ncbi:MAG TPA: hypothetical protein VMV74_11235 [Bacteroidales bacterium]|nr:hypothetical protein [Bacteroidales bacterium]
MKKLTYEQMELASAGGHFWEDMACNFGGGINGAIFGALIGGPVGLVAGLLISSILSVGCSAGVHMND